MLALEVGQQLADDLALAAHGPEAQRPVAARRAAAERQRRAAAQQRTARAQRRRLVHGRALAGRRAHSSSSQPPVKPARSRPRRICGLRVIVCHTEPSV